MAPSPYLTRGLIAYLGNKRALFSFLSEAFGRCAAALEIGRTPRFLDPFAGSGGVSRLARSLGYRVFSADLERYAALLGRCRLCLDPERLERAFLGEGESAAAFDAVADFARGVDSARAAASLPPGSAREAWRAAFERSEDVAPYLARHYAPQSTERADWRTERLFYTAENARFLDRAREAVERRYPLDPLASDAALIGEPTAADAKAALLDALLYQAATRANTSGVFKACHRGFGGHGKDALNRIMAPMTLTPPELIYGPEAVAACADAASFCAAHPADLVYLDPPYNQHQYGSNYHLLNTVARWDKPPVSEERGPDGFLLDRSGIRADWVATRSDFCRRPTARAALASLLDAIEAPFVLLSYNDGGVIALEELREELEARGTLDVVARPYVAYRGGKQSATRVERTSELLFVLDTRARAPRGAAAALRRISALGALDALLRARFDPARARAALAAGTPRVGEDGRLDLRDFIPSAAPIAELEALAAALSSCVCRSSAEAFDVVSAALAASTSLEYASADSARVRALAADALGLLAKLCFRKYSADYLPRSARLRSLLERLSGSARLISRLDALDRRAQARGVAPIG